jgi:hypothetical protein
VIARLKPYIDRFGYREAVDAALNGTPTAKSKPQIREKEPS